MKRLLLSVDREKPDSSAGPDTADPSAPARPTRATNALTTNGMEQPHCSPHSMFSKEPSSGNASRGTGIKSSYAFSPGLISQSTAAWRSISCWTIMGPINIPKVKKWLAKRPRYHGHFTPPSSSWLNQAARWFAEITRKRIRRGTFHSVGELVKAIRITSAITIPTLVLFIGLPARAE